MNETTGSFLFRGWPYLALALAAAGFAVRLLLTGDRVPALRRAMPRARARVPRRAAVDRRVARCSPPRTSPGLLFPRAVLAWTRTPWHAGRAGGGRASRSALGGAGGLRPRRVAAHAPAVARRLVAGGRLRRFGVPVVPVHRRRVRVAGGRAFTAGDRSGRRSRWRPTRRRCCTGGPCRRSSSTCRSLVRLHLFASFAALAVLPGHAPGRACRWRSRTGRSPSPGARSPPPRGPSRAWVQRKPAAWLWPDHEVRWVGAAARGRARPARPRARPRRGGRVLGPGAGAAAKPTRSKAV